MVGRMASMVGEVHRIIEQFGLEETFEDHLVQSPSAAGREIFH